MSSTRMPRAVSRYLLNADSLAGVLAVLLGLVFVVGAYRVPRSSSDFSVIGPEVFPGIIGVGMLFCGGALLVKGIVPSVREQLPGKTVAAGAPTQGAATSSDSSFSVPAEDVGGDHKTRWRPLLLLVSLGAYIIAFVPLGYLVSTILFLTTVTCMTSVKSWKTNLVYSVIFSAVVYLVFTRLLGIGLPSGLLTF